MSGASFHRRYFESPGLGLSDRGMEEEDPADHRRAGARPRLRVGVGVTCVEALIVAAATTKYLTL